MHMFSVKDHRSGCPDLSPLEENHWDGENPFYFRARDDDTNRDICVTVYKKTDNAHMEIVRNKTKISQAIGERHHSLLEINEVFENDESVFTITPFINQVEPENNEIYSFHDQIFTPGMNLVSDIHQQGFTHGDLTDSNILLTKDSFHVIDFEHSIEHDLNHEYEDQLEFSSSKLEDLWDISKSMQSHWQSLKNKGTSWKLNQNPENCPDYQNMEEFLELMDLDQAFPDGIEPLKEIGVNDRYMDGLEMNGEYPTGQEMIEIMDEIYDEYTPRWVRLNR